MQHLLCDRLDADAALANPTCKSPSPSPLDQAVRIAGDADGDPYPDMSGSGS